MTTDHERQAERQLSAQPAPYIMGHDRFQITEKRCIESWDHINKRFVPTMIVYRKSEWEVF